MTNTQDERRAHPRFCHSFELSGMPASGGATARLIANDLSMGGLYCTSDSDFPEMTRLAVRLLLPARGRAAEPLDLSAVVVRRTRLSTSEENGFELALLFSPLTDVQRERLGEFLAQS